MKGALHRVARWACAILVGVVLVGGMNGCAGPSKLTRQLDQSYNQTYVDNPLLTEAMLPLFAVGFVGAWILDHALVNPVYWWEDAIAGQGTPFYYRNPTVPETPAEETGD